MRKLLKIADITTDAGTQIRAALNDATVTEYAEAMQAKAVFPAVDVFHDGSRYYLADGFHRLFAAKTAGQAMIEAEIHQGTRADCLKFALGANVRHGLRRTNADKRHAVELALKEWPDLADREIARICAVHQSFVGNIRGELSMVDSSLNPPTRIGADGKRRAIPPPPAPKPPPPPPPPVAQATPPAPPTPPTTPAPRPAAPQTATEAPRDKTGFPIPPRLRDLWDRSEAVQQSCLSPISTIRGIMRKAEETGDLAFVGCSFGTALAALDQAFATIQCAKPYAVCPTCQGQTPDNCGTCHKKGIVSEFFWKTCVPEEVKQIRFKTQK